MVNPCINPACRAEFRLLRVGDVYAVERPYAETELVWICSACASDFELAFDPSGVFSVSRRAGRKEPLPLSPHGTFRLVEKGVGGVALHRSGVKSNNPATGQSGDWGNHARGANF
jgi:hypothetical protein